MNLYLLVEDGKSGQKIISRWIKLLLPFLEPAKTVASVHQNNYIVFSGFGYPRILGTNPESPEKNVLGATIETINDSGRFDCLLLFIDGDHEGAEARKQQVHEKISTYENTLTIPYFVFIQNICFETWLLGHGDLLPHTPSPHFAAYLSHYDTSSFDPEAMPNNPAAGVATASLYHERYLRALLKESGHHYNKSRPAPIVMTAPYLGALKKRTQETVHLKSLAEFFEFMESISRLGSRRPAPNTLR